MAGNHDEAAIRRHDWGRPAHLGLRGDVWLDDDDADWLRALPASWQATIDGVRLLACHGAPGDSKQGLYPDSPASASGSTTAPFAGCAVVEPRLCLYRAR